MARTVPQADLLDDGFVAAMNVACRRRARGLYPCDRRQAHLDPEWLDKIANEAATLDFVRFQREQSAAPAVLRAERAKAARAATKRGDARHANAETRLEEALVEIGRLWALLTVELGRPPEVDEARARFIAETDGGRFHFIDWKRGVSLRTFQRYLAQARRRGHVRKG